MKYCWHTMWHSSVLKDVLERRVEGKSVKWRHYMWEGNIKKISGRSMCCHDTRHEVMKWKMSVSPWHRAGSGRSLWGCDMGQEVKEICVAITQDRKWKKYVSLWHTTRSIGDSLHLIFNADIVLNVDNPALVYNLLYIIRFNS